MSNQYYTTEHRANRFLDLTKSLHPVVYGAPPPGGARDSCGVRQFANGRIDYAGLPSEATHDSDDAPATKKKVRNDTESDSDSENDGDGDGDGEDNANDDDDDNDPNTTARPAQPASRNTLSDTSERPPTPGPSKPPQRAVAPTGVRFRAVPVHIHDTPRRAAARTPSSS